MAIMILGAGGLLGSHICALYPKETIPVPRMLCDVTKRDEIRAVLHQHKPVMVVNCAGIVKANKDSEQWVFDVNAEAPHIIQEECDELGIKLVQISTDCVYGDHAIDVTESILPKPTDMYGVSKLMGELYPRSSDHLTVRCSFVGWPDPKERGLMAWFMQAPSPIQGYQNVMWNGLTTKALADWIIQHGMRYSGLLHVHGRVTYSKDEMLRLFDWVYETDKVIVSVKEPQIQRVLKSERTTVVQPQESLEEMVYALRGEEKRLWQFLKLLS